MFTTNIKAWQTKVEYQKTRREEAGQTDPEKKLSYAQVEDKPAAEEEKKATAEETTIP